MADFLRDIFNTPVRTAFDAYKNTAGTLADLRTKRIANALSQIQLNNAPQMAAADLAIKQNQAAYAPKLSQANLDNIKSMMIQHYAETKKSNLESVGVGLDNIIKKAEAEGAPDKVKAQLDLLKAQIDFQHAHADAVSKAAGLKNAVTAYGATTGAAYQVPKNPADSQIQGSPSMQSSLTSQGMPAQTSEESPEDLLYTAGPLTARGQPGALYNPKTKERFSVLSPTQKSQMQTQLIAIKQAIPLLDDLKKYGTVGAIGAEGVNKLLPNAWGGVPFDVSKAYSSSRDRAVEHVLTGSKLNKTGKAVDLMHNILTRANGESRDAYINRMSKYQEHLKNLDKYTTDSLGRNAVSLDKDPFADEEKYYSDEYDNLNNKVNVISPEGKPGKLDKSELEEALKHGWKKR